MATAIALHVSLRARSHLSRTREWRGEAIRREGFSSRFAARFCSRGYGSLCAPTWACSQAIALPGINDLRRSVTPIFFDRSFSLPIFYLSIRCMNFCKMHHRIPFFLALRLSVRRFQFPFEGLSFLKTLAACEIAYATDPLLQSMSKIVFARTQFKGIL